MGTITSTSIREHIQTGIIKIIVNTEDKWIDYGVSKEGRKLVLSHFYDIETQPGCFDSYEEKELIAVKDSFNSFDYILYTAQEKNQITIICIPKTFMIDKENWKNI